MSLISIVLSFCVLLKGSLMTGNAASLVSSACCGLECSHRFCWSVRYGDWIGRLRYLTAGGQLVGGSGVGCGLPVSSLV